MENSMLNRLAVAAAVANALAVSFPAMADTFNTTANVSSTITLTETTPLSFGNIFAVASTAGDGTEATMTVSTAGAVSVTAGSGDSTSDSRIVSLGGATAGELTVSGAATYTDLTVTSGAGLVNLVHSSGSPNAAIFTMDSITTSPATTTTGQTDGTGALTILVGGVIGASDTTTYSSGYLDGTYTGSYDVSVSY